MKTVMTEKTALGDALEEGRKRAAREMYDRVRTEVMEGPEHDAYNSPERAALFILRVRTAMDDYERIADRLSRVPR